VAEEFGRTEKAFNTALIILTKTKIHQETIQNPECPMSQSRLCGSSN
jgi:hypothetical protein